MLTKRTTIVAPGDKNASELKETRGSEYSTKLNIVYRYHLFLNTIAVCTIVVTIPVQSSLYPCAAKMTNKERKIFKND